MSNNPNEAMQTIITFLFLHSSALNNFVFSMACAAGRYSPLIMRWTAASTQGSEGGAMASREQFSSGIGATQIEKQRLQSQRSISGQSPFQSR